jgi:hypothetical protein
MGFIDGNGQGSVAGLEEIGGESLGFATEE